MRDFRDINWYSKPVDFFDMFFVFEDTFKDIIDGFFHDEFEVFQTSILLILRVFLLLELSKLLVPDPRVLV